MDPVAAPKLRGGGAGVELLEDRDDRGSGEAGFLHVSIRSPKVPNSQFQLDPFRHLRSQQGVHNHKQTAAISLRRPSHKSRRLSFLLLGGRNMRLSSNLEPGGFYVMLAALLAGCSNASPGTSPLPRSSSSSPAVVGQVRPASMPHSPLELLKMQAEGKLPGPVPPNILRAQLKQIETRPRLHLNVRPNIPTVQIWTSLSPYDYVLGTPGDGTKVIAAINTENQTTGGTNPFGLKVDHSQPLGCQRKWRQRLFVWCRTGVHGRYIVERLQRGMSRTRQHWLQLLRRSLDGRRRQLK